MLQSSKDIQVSVCRPCYFYNVSQRHNFLVYDFRPTICTQKLKNTFKLNSIAHQSQLNNVLKSQELVSYVQDQLQENIDKLFQQRKRIFNFFLPFEGSDSFTIYLSDYLYSIDEQQKQRLSDQFSISIADLEDLCAKYRDEIKDELILIKRTHQDTQPHSDQLIQDFAADSLSPELSRELSRSPQRRIRHNWSSTPNLVQYDVLEQEISNVDLFQSMLGIIKTFKQEKIREVFIIFEPAKIMFDQYPLLDYCILKNKKNLDKTLPNEIVEGKMYLGNADHAMNQDLLVQQLKITHIVNAAKEVKNGITGVTYLKIQICDEVTENIKEHFENVYQFIDQIWNDEDSRILIHCAQGRSRSAALVIMFLMKKYSWSLDVAHKYVQERREVVSVNEGFMKQLQIYETQIDISQF